MRSLLSLDQSNIPGLYIYYGPSLIDFEVVGQEHPCTSQAYDDMNENSIKRGGHTAAAIQHQKKEYRREAKSH